MKETEVVPELTVDNGYVLCPDCKTQVNVGKVGVQNYYKRHQGSAQCAANKKKKRIEDVTEKTKQNTLRFFRPRAPAVPPTVKTLSWNIGSVGGCAKPVKQAAVVCDDDEHDV